MARVALPLAAGLLAAALILPLFWSPSQGRAPAGPLAFPATVDAGEIPFGTDVPIAVPVTNQSGQPIRLTGFRTGCGCMSPNRRTAAGRLEPLADLTLAPGEELTAVIVVRVQAATPSFAHAFAFRTDHPAVPEVIITLRGRVALGVVSTPNLISFDTVAPGETATAIVVLTDLRPEPDRGPLDIRPDDPAVVVRGITPGGPARGTYRVTLALSGERAGPVSGKLLVRSAAGVLLGEVPFSGRVTPPARLVPSVVVLPRPGIPDPNTARVTCRSASPFRLDLGPLPAGLDVQVDGQDLVVRRGPTLMGPCSMPIKVKVLLDQGRVVPLSLIVTVRASDTGPSGQP